MRTRFKCIINNISASISVFLSLALVGIISLQLTIGFLAGRTIYHNLLSKGMDQQLEYGLSHYDSALKKRFGIMALFELPDLDIINHYAHLFREPYFYKRPEYAVDMNLSHAMDENLEELEGQIKNFTLLRTPSQIFSQIKKRIDLSEENIFKEQGVAKKSLDEAENALSNINEALSYDTENEEKDSERNFAKEQIENFLDSILDGLTFEAEDSSLASGPSAVFSLLNRGFSEFSNFSQRIDNSPLRKLILLFYTVNQFSFHTAPFRDGKNVDTKDGSIHNKLLSGIRRTEVPAADNHEVEGVIWHNEAELAFNKMKFFIGFTRFLAHEISIHKSSEYNSALATSRIISAAITILTLGYITIPPQVIAELIILVKSVIRANRDVKLILKGEAVELIPKLVDFKIYYSDFLYLRGLFQTQENLLLGVCRNIEDNMQEKYFFGINIDLYLFDVLGTNKFYMERKISLKDVGVASK